MSDQLQGAVRVAVIGCGTITGRSHLPALRAIDGVEVVAFASGSIASAQRAADQWGSGTVHPDWHEAIDRADVDAVLVATPNDLHAAIAIYAAGLGKHVLVEKPMACDLAGANAMVTAAADAGVVLMPAHNMRFEGLFLAAQQAVRNGRLGTVLDVRAGFGHPGPQHWAPEARWFRDPDRSAGGALIDLGIHVIDLLHAVTGARIVEVSGMLAGPEGEVEESAHLTLRFAGGALGTVLATWRATPGPDVFLTVQGTQGRLHVDLVSGPSITSPEGAVTRLPVPPTRSVVAAFVDALRGVPPAVTAADGLAAVAVVEAAYTSARTGNVTRVAQL